MIIFIDTTAPCSYHIDNIETADVGASEKSAIMIAEYLASHKHSPGHSKSVFFLQRFGNFENSKSQTNVVYKNIEFINFIYSQKRNEEITFIILRNPDIVLQLYPKFPKSNFILTLDDLYDPKWFANFPVNIPVKIICKSQWHLDHVKDLVFKQKSMFIDGDFIYNPILEKVFFTRPPVDKNKLLFASSPHKGLDYTLKLFVAIRQRIPSLKLYIANPNYLKIEEPPKIDGVVYLGKLSYLDLLKEMASSFCVFYPNISYPETFGCSLVEANYVGTPILAHENFGALPEVLENTTDQLIDCSNPTLVYETLMRWRVEGRPFEGITMKKDFVIENVGRKWIEMINSLRERNPYWNAERALACERALTSEGPLKILIVRRTRLADAPDSVAEAINKYTPHKATISCVPLPGYDVIHYNNIFIPLSLNASQRSVIQYHSEPERVSDKNSFPFIDKEILDRIYPRELVLAQYHATLPRYKNCKIVRNIIMFDENPLYNLKRTNTLNDSEAMSASAKIQKIKIGYSPSTLARLNQHADKGYEETKKILEELPRDKFEIDIITQVPLEECIQRKSDCDVIIDECVTGSYHRSALEGLALGKMTICYLNDDVMKVFMDSTTKEVSDSLLNFPMENLGEARFPFENRKAGRSPMENVEISKLKEFLLSLDYDIVVEKGIENRKWMERWWHPKDIAEEFIQIYRGAL